MQKTSLRRCALQSTIIAGIAGIGFGQLAVAQDEEAEARQETVVVTGSQIVNSNISSSSPVTTIGADVFDARGVVDTIDLINSLPQATVLYLRSARTRSRR